MRWFKTKPRSQRRMERSIELLECRDLLSVAPMIDPSDLAVAMHLQTELRLVEPNQSQNPDGPVLARVPINALHPNGFAPLADSSENVSDWDVEALSDSLTGLDIVINAGATLLANQAALDAFNRAAALWETLFADPITVTISADLVNLGGGGIIGQASSVLLTNSYTTYRNRLVSDADSDDAIVAFLPTAGQFTATLPPGFGVTTSLSGTKASLKAAGVTGLDGIYGATDSTIQFNTLFSFDFDNSNGVTAGTIDFETVAAHEIGHALGFTSIVDTVDAYLYAGSTANVTPHLLDLFRFANNVSGQDPGNSSQFTTYPRFFNTGGNAILDDTSNERRVSTGVHTGDGRQASHWKDNGLTGTLIGIMDPTLAYGQVVAISSADIRALDLIGWDYIVPANQPPVLNSIGNKSVAEGSLLSFTATASDPNAGDQLTYSLGAGAPAGASIHPTSGLFTWTPADSVSVPPSVTIIVSDNGTPLMSDSETIQITVNNVAPTAALVGSPSGVRGQPLTYTLLANDPSSIDQAAGFTFAIDWNGDLVTDQTVVGPSGTTVSHVFPNSGNFNVRVTATDKDGGTSAVFTHPMSVANWALVPNGGNPLLTDLLWGGTTAADSLYFVRNYAGAIEVYDLALGSLIVAPIAGITGDVVVYLQSGDDLLVMDGLLGASFDSGDGNDALAILSASSGDFTLTGGIGHDKLFVVDGQNIQVTLDGGDGDDELFMLDGLNIQATMLAGAGSDALVIVGGSAINALMDGGSEDDMIIDMSSGATTVTALGGSGDDLVIGGSGADSLDGGMGNDLVLGGAQGTDGNDTILGGDGNDVLVGHHGADVLQGGVGEDLLLTGYFDPLYFGDEPVPGIIQIWDQWRTTDPLVTRIGYLTGTPGGIIDLAFAMIAGSTVLDDGSNDTFSGATSGDWFLYDFGADLALDYSAAEDVRTDLG